MIQSSEARSLLLPQEADAVVEQVVVEVLVQVQQHLHERIFLTDVFYLRNFQHGRVSMNVLFAKEESRLARTILYLTNLLHFDGICLFHLKVEEA